MAEKKTKTAARKGQKKAAKPLDAGRIDQSVREIVGEACYLLAPAVKHLLMAEKELLLAVRAVLDKAIEKTDELAERQLKRGEQARKVKIKVE